jgi:hypothetical protein
VEFQRAAQEVFPDVGAEISDVGEIVDRGTASIRRVSVLKMRMAAAFYP